MGLKLKLICGVFLASFLSLPLYYLFASEKLEVLTPFLFFCLGCLSAGFLLFLFVQRFFIRRLALMRKSMNHIATSKDLTGRIADAGRDEISELSQSINQMLDSLDKSRTQLLESQKMEAIGRLAGGMAHDFNNILCSILGYSSILKEKYAADEKTTRQIDVIIRAAEKGSQLTKDLLGFAQKGMYEKSDLDLNRSIREALNFFSPSLGNAISTHQELSENLWTIEGDSNQILQVLIHLLVNSRDAMPQGGEIFIRTQNHILSEADAVRLYLPQGDYVRIDFQDTGVGIPPENRTRIFDPFFTTKKNGKGSGLGLSMIYGILQKHKGAILLDSTLPKGALFHLYFPAKDQQIRTIFVQEKSAPQLLQESILNGKKILLMDDETDTLSWTDEILTQAGAEVLCARSGEEAIKIVNQENRKIDVMVFDVILPGINGIKTYYKIRDLGAKIPIIFVSTFMENSEIIQLKRQENVIFIQKPFKKEDLLSALTVLFSPH